MNPSVAGPQRLQFMTLFHLAPLKRAGGWQMVVFPAVGSSASDFVRHGQNRC